MKDHSSTQMAPRGDGYLLERGRGTRLCSWKNVCRVHPHSFRDRLTEGVFQDYVSHLHVSLVTQLYGLYAFVGIALSILSFVDKKSASLDNVALAVLGMICAAWCGFSCIKCLHGHRKRLTLAAYTLWFILLIFGALWIFLLIFGAVSLPIPHIRADDNPASGVWEILLVILTAYSAMPVWFPFCLLLGLVLPSAHCASVILIQGNLTENWPTVAANCVLFAVINALGMFLRYIYERGYRRSFLASLRMMEKRVERGAVDRRLNDRLAAHLPKFVCAEVKEKLLRYESPCPRESPCAAHYEDASILSVHLQGMELLRSSHASSSEFVALLCHITTVFEQLCETNSCLPIHSTGDLFMAVCGLPTTSSDHATRCVALAQDLLLAFKCVHRARGVPVSALMGVHTGSVCAGVVGSLHWRYDCCGTDVMVAHHVSTTGSADKIHVSETTLRSLPMGDYCVESCSSLHGLTLPTYHIQPKIESKSKPVLEGFQRSLVGLSGGETPSSAPAALTGGNSLAVEEEEGGDSTRLISPVQTNGCVHGKLSDSRSRKKSHSKRKPSSLTDIDMSSSSASSMSAQLVHLLARSVSTGLISEHSLSALHPLTLRFRDPAKEAQYYQENFFLAPSLACLALLVLSQGALHLLTLSRTIFLLGTYIVILFTLVLLLISLLAVKLKVSRTRCLHSTTAQLVILCGVFALIAVSAVLNVLSCDSSTNLLRPPTELLFGISGGPELTTNSCLGTSLALSAYLTLLCVLVLFDLSHLPKLLLLTFVGGAYGVAIMYTHTSLFLDFPYNVQLTAHLHSVLSIVFLLALIVLQSRHLEWIVRLGLHWRCENAQEDSDQVKLARCEAHVLDTGLPAHIREMRRVSQQDLFVRDHQQLTVATVTIPNYTAVTAERQAAHQPLMSMSLLASVVDSFDQLLARDDYRYVVEKVYSAGTTYVMVAGVHQANYAQANNNEDLVSFCASKLLEVLLEMKALLRQFGESGVSAGGDNSPLVRGNNNLCGGGLMLRGGVALGECVEGVVGSTHQQYNLWGPAVEASKLLEGSGKLNQIQVTKKIAALTRRRFQFHSRDQAMAPCLAALGPSYLLGRRQGQPSAPSVPMTSPVSPSGAVREGMSAGGSVQSFTGLGPFEGWSMRSGGSQSVLAGGTGCTPGPGAGGGGGGDIMPMSAGCAVKSPFFGPVGKATGGSSSRLRSQSGDLGSYSSSARMHQGQGVVCGTAGAPKESGSVRKMSTASHGSQSGSTKGFRLASPELPAIHYKNTTPSKRTSNDSRTQLILTQHSVTGDRDPASQSDAGSTGRAGSIPCDASTHSSRTGRGGSMPRDSSTHSSLHRESAPTPDTPHRPMFTMESTEELCAINEPAAPSGGEMPPAGHSSSGSDTGLEQSPASKKPPVPRGGGGGSGQLHRHPSSASSARLIMPKPLSPVGELAANRRHSQLNSSADDSSRLSCVRDDSARLSGAHSDTNNSESSAHPTGAFSRSDLSVSFRSVVPAHTDTSGSSPRDNHNSNSSATRSHSSTVSDLRPPSATHSDHSSGGNGKARGSSHRHSGSSGHDSRLGLSQIDVGASDDQASTGLPYRDDEELSTSVYCDHSTLSFSDTLQNSHSDGRASDSLTPEEFDPRPFFSDESAHLPQYCHQPQPRTGIPEQFPVFEQALKVHDCVGGGPALNLLELSPPRSIIGPSRAVAKREERRRERQGRSSDSSHSQSSTIHNDSSSSGGKSERYPPPSLFGNASGASLSSSGGNTRGMPPDIHSGNEESSRGEQLVSLPAATTPSHSTGEAIQAIFRDIWGGVDSCASNDNSVTNQGQGTPKRSAARSPLALPPPPSDLESELSEDERGAACPALGRCGQGYQTSTDYDNCFSDLDQAAAGGNLAGKSYFPVAGAAVTERESGGAANRFGHGYSNGVADKFSQRLQRMQQRGQSSSETAGTSIDSGVVGGAGQFRGGMPPGGHDPLRDLFSELESDACDGEESVVSEGETDFELEAPSLGGSARASRDMSGTRELNWVDNRLMMDLVMRQRAPSASASTRRRYSQASVAGASSVTASRSMECLVSDAEDYVQMPTPGVAMASQGRRRGGRFGSGVVSGYLAAGRRGGAGNRTSVASSLLGSQFSLSDPHLASHASLAYESEYDNYNPGDETSDDEWTHSRRPGRRLPSGELPSYLRPADRDLLPAGRDLHPAGRVGAGARGNPSGQVHPNRFGEGELDDLLTFDEFRMDNFHIPNFINLLESNIQSKR